MTLEERVDTGQVGEHDAAVAAGERIAVPEATALRSSLGALEQIVV